MSSHPELVVVTPEHVDVRLEVADVGSRAAAVILDLLLQLLAVFALLVLGLVVMPVSRDLGGALVFLLFFVVRNFYFTFFELRWNGRTPGKRALGLRVVARDGGALTADLVFARNLTREVELFLPLAAWLSPWDLLPGAPVWVNLVTVGWVFAVGLLPLLNRHRARLGDLVAGTVVVREPRPVLLEDLTAVGARRQEQGESFTAAELAIYGIEELQVLEELLRRAPGGDQTSLLVAAASKIRRKIGRKPGPPAEAEAFLRSFYAAQRAHLERKLLFGQRKESKGA